MAKTSYNIPYPLDASYLDMEIAIQSEKGIGVRPFPIKNILIVIFAVAGCYICLEKTTVQYGTLIQKALFVIIWGALCALLLLTTKTHQLGLEKIPSLINYMNPASRRIITRTNSPAGDFTAICGLMSIEDDGLILYTDGSVGRAYDIIGSGSILLFENHKTAILDRVDSHYRKMRPNTTYQFITVKESQQVELQIKGFDERLDNLTVDDPDLVQLTKTNRYVLKNIIGSAFKSLHQYLIVQCPNAEELVLALNVLQSEIDNSDLMFKFVEQLDKNRTISLFTSVYGTRKEIKRFGMTRKQKARKIRENEDKVRKAKVDKLKAAKSKKSTVKK